ncbi:Vesicle trafficking between the ER and Golgi [Sorochytrium milnesiophthora]
MTKNLRDLFTESLVRMLTLNVEPSTSASLDPASGVNAAIPFSQPVWKVLVFDNTGRDIISPVLRVPNLRENGVTVHMPLHSTRQPIADVPAVYFMEPTQENVNRLVQDLSAGLYDSYYVNFTSTVSRPVLEELASATVQHNTAQHIAQLYDQHLSYIVTEPNLFSLAVSNSYYNLNRGNATAEAMEQLMNRVVDGLFDVCATMGTIPLIRCPRGNAAEAIAQKLDAKLRSHAMNPRNGLFNAESNLLAQRPVMVLVDRQIDLSALLLHTWNYNGLIHDVLEMRLNRITVPVEENGRKGKKGYDLDVGDFFWAKHSGAPFLQVAEQVDAELNRYKTETQELLRASGASSIEEMAAQSDTTMNAKQLKSALTQIPLLQERKNTIDMHMNIATALLSAIGARRLDVIFEMEESISKCTKAQLLEAINDPATGNADDKLRLFLVYYLSVDNVPAADLEEYSAALTKAGCDVSAISYIKRARSFSKMASATSSAAGPATSSRSTGDFLGRFSSLGNKLTENLKEGNLTSAYSTLLGSVKNLLPISRDLPITRAVESIMSGSGDTNDEYLLFDPRTKRDAGSNRNVMQTGNRNRAGYDEAIVFVVGGGGYVEYQNLMELEKQGNGKRKITYGCTELLTPSMFLKQIAMLSSE